jgi:hypothetical protein
MSRYKTPLDELLWLYSRRQGSLFDVQSPQEAFLEAHPAHNILSCPDCREWLCGVAARALELGLQLTWDRSVSKR